MNTLQSKHKPDLSAFYNKKTDADRLSQQILICTGLLYGLSGLAFAGFLPFWSLLAIVPLLIVRWILFVHDLFHLCKATDIHPVIRLLPILLTPLSLGYGEYQDVHFQHHRFMATPDDPEYYQIRGSKLAGLFNALTSPEQAYFRWLAAKGMDGSLLRDSLVRLALFGAIVALTGWAFLWYWVPLRLSYGISYFVFFYCVHRRGEAYGVYSLPLSPQLQTFLTLLFGRDALLAICYHDVHHAHPKVGSHYLSSVQTISDGVN